MRRLVKMGKLLALIVVGLVLGFDPVFAVLFTDKHAHSDYIMGLLFVGGAFAMLAGLSGLLARSWRVPFILTPPSILILIAYSYRETQQIPYHFAVAGTLLLSTALGAVAGSHLRSSGR